METSTHTKTTTEGTDECCPVLDLDRWEKKEHHWNKKLFLKDSVPELFHIPLPGTYKKAINRMWKKAADAGAAPGRHDFLLLAHDPSMFKGELFMAVTKEVPGGDNVKISGTFISKVFDGPYSKVPHYLSEMSGFLSSIGKKSLKDYIYYAYCPDCAKKYGHNYVVVLSQVV